VAGQGAVEQFRVMARERGVEDRVDFLGVVPNRSVIELMRSADAVVVPSRHEYTEAFPLTIIEALTCRTPLVVSDHPMFRDRLQDDVSALFFPAGQANELAARVTRLFGDPALYRSLSENSAAAWEALRIPVGLAELFTRWLEDTPESREWLREHRLASGRYR
jgi:glycosyltransferase involved in cell wall biosynthesis